MPNKPSHFCRVCGKDQGESPWGEDDQTPTFNICDCCGVTFGYQDCKLSAVKKYRREWLLNGGKWFWPKSRSENWNLEEQLKNIPEEYK